MARLTGKTALITGGTTGIGLATAQLFLQEGARVAITGQDADRVAEAARTLGHNVIALQANVASKSEMNAVAAHLKEAFGTLDIVFANAGIAQAVAFSDLNDAHIDDQLNVNVKGVIYTLQTMLPLLNNPASVILTASTVAEQGPTGLSVYAATKAAVRSLARTLSAELVGQGVRVNAVSPGPIDTPIFGKFGFPADTAQALVAELTAKVPAGRFGTSQEIAKAVLFLASDDSSYILGENLLVDGGMAAI